MIDINLLFLEINQLKAELINIEQYLDSYDDVYNLVSKYYDIEIQVKDLDNEDVQKDFEKLKEIFEYNLKNYSLFFIVNSDYVSRDKKYLFYNGLYYFEKIIVPDADGKINYISDRYKYKIIDLASQYADALESDYYVYYIHNPYGNVNGEQVLIIEKREFRDKELFLNDVTNYVNNIYDIYYFTYKDTIESMASKLDIFEEKYNELNYFYNKKYDELKTIIDEKEYYIAVNDFENAYNTYKSEIISLGLYYYIELKDKFESLFNKFENFIYELKKDDRYMKYFSKIDFENFSNLLHEYLDYLYYNKNEDYIEYIKGYSVKDIIEKIVYYMKNYYFDFNLKYFSFDTNEFEYKLFKFYEYVEFEQFMKEYLYKLMTKDINLVDINIEKDLVNYPFILDLKNKFENYYNVFLKYKEDYYEIYTYEDMKIVIDNFNRLKKSMDLAAVNYFMNAMRNLPNVYYNYFKNKYDEYKKEVEEFQIKLNEILEEKKNKEYSDDMLLVFKAIDEIEYYYNKAVEFKQESFDNLILLSNFDIFAMIEQMFGDELNKIKDLFKQEKYKLCIEEYLFFKKTNKVYMEIINLFEKVNEKYLWLKNNIDKILLNIEKELSVEEIYDIMDMLEYFRNEEYIYNRNSFILNIDLLYDYIKNVYSADNIVIISNERDFKKSYYDNLLFYYFVIMVYTVYKNINSEYERLEQLRNIYNSQSEFLKLFLKSIAFISNNSYLEQFINSIFNVLVNYVDVFIPDLLKDLDEYNKFLDIKELYNVLNEYKEKEIEKFNEYLVMENENYIPDVKYVNIDDITEMDVYGPINIKFKASPVLENEDIEYRIRWYYGDNVDEGNEIEIYFEFVGEYTIIVELLYSDGKKYVKNIKINVKDIKLTSYLRMGTMGFNNQALAWDIKYRPKLYYYDVDKGYARFVTLDLKAPLSDTIKDGYIYFDTELDKMTRDLSNVFLFGFYGDGIPGEFVSNNYLLDKIKNTDDWWSVEIPEMEFLFDFRYSMPVEKRMVVDVRDSVNVLKMFRIPADVNILKDIDDISEFSVASAEYLEVIPGDKIGFLNKKGRWAIIEFTDIIDETDIYNYDFQFGVRFIVNTADELKLKTNFKTQIFEMDFPLIQFETNMIELFNSIIERIDRINELKKKLEIETDKELINSYKAEIEKLESENTNNYVSMEIKMLEQKKEQLNIIFEKLYGTYFIEDNVIGDYNELLKYEFKDDVKKYIEFYKDKIDNYKTFEEIVNSIEPYDFYNSFIDMKKYIDVIDKEIKYLSVILSLFRVDFEDGFFDPIYEFLKEENMIEDESVFDGLNDIEKSIKIIKIIREKLYKIKLINDLDTKSISLLKFSDNYEIWVKDFLSGEWMLKNDKDKYLFFKKLELLYGKEVPKIQDGYKEIDEISEIVDYVKSIDNLNFSKDELIDKSLYIQNLEENIVEEYDKFYLISYWITYIEKKYLPSIN